MKPRPAPDASHASAETRRLNPNLFPPAAAIQASVAAVNAGTATVKPRRAKEPNATEREYELMLRAAYPHAVIRWEAYTLRLANRCTYTPDWSVMFTDGRIEMHEVKGAYLFPKALAKPRVAAEVFNHRFVLAQKLKTGWQITEISGEWTRRNPTG